MTDADIQKVKQNLVNLQAFNDYLFNHGNPFIANAYALLNEKNTDKGMAVCVNMMESAFWAMAAVDSGGAAAFGANTLCGILNAWSSVPPPDMGGAFADLIRRFQAASEDVDNQLAIYHSDPAAYWNTVFSYQGHTCTLGDLATIDFPAESDPLFFTYMNPCLWALDQWIWKDILTSGGFIIAEWLPEVDIPPPFDFVAWQNSFYGYHPAYWATCEYHQDSGSCGDSSYYMVTEYNLSTGANEFHDGHISDDACNYLFADRAPCQSYSSCTRGLFPRADVFTKWGITKKQVWVATGSAQADAEYLQAKKDGKPVLSDLQAKIGADGIKARILDAVRQDPTLKARLHHGNTHEVLEQVLGVKVPKFVNFAIVFEGPRQHGLVIPWQQAAPTFVKKLKKRLKRLKRLLGVAP